MPAAYRIMFQGELVEYVDGEQAAIDRLASMALSGPLIKDNCRAFLRSQGSFSCSPRQFLFARRGLLRLERCDNSTCPADRRTPQTKGTSMTIETVERYTTMGREFTTHQAAVQFRVDQLGEFLDPALGIWAPGEKLKLVKFLVDNRANIRHLLDF